MTRRMALAAALPLMVGGALAAQKPAAKKPQASATAAGLRTFLKTHCDACHNAKVHEGNLDLTALRFTPTQKDNAAIWKKVHDRVRDGAMPPPGAGNVPAAARSAFLKSLASAVGAQAAVAARSEGRSVWRRMNRYEVENSLRDLLGSPWLQVRDMLPEDGEAYHFNKVGEALDISHVHMNRYLQAAEYALRESMSPHAARPEATVRRYYTRQMGSFVGPASFSNFNSSPERATFPLLGNTCDEPALMGKAPMTVGESDPATREKESMGVIASAYEPLEPKFDRFRAPVAGRYRLTLSAYTFWAGPESPQRWWRPSRKDVQAGRTQEPITLYAELPPRQLRKLDSFDVFPDTPDKPAPTHTVEVWLRKGETIRPDAVRFFRSRPPNWRNPLAQKDGQPGVAFKWLEVRGPLYDTWPTRGHRLMFGDLPLKSSAGAVGVESSNPDADSRRLLANFVKRAFRRPVTAADLDPYVRLAKTARDAGMSFVDAQIAAYSGVLCSPNFLTLEERPGPLDDFALASRLSYFLWNTEPDAALRSLAVQGALRKPAVLRAQTERMLADPRSERFVDAFLDYWLDLRKVGIVSPNEVLYADYYLDDFLVESSVDETHAFFAELIRGDLPARNLVSSNFAMVNQRLAELYGIPGVQGAAIRKVNLPADSVRGGLLTQASILKVTANGTTTSPVVRGAWVNERILGIPVPPPPAAVPAVEPDTRGATTIREQLAKHRSQPACSACHAKIDPTGFALENFDVFGGWRDRYRALGPGTPTVGRGKNGLAFEFHDGPAVDPSGALPDGRAFANIRELKQILARDDRAVAANLVKQLVVYATGAPVGFADQKAVDAILDRTRPSRYGVRSLIGAIVQSDLFRNK